LERGQAAASAEVPVRDSAVIEPYRDQPGLFCLPQPQLLDCQDQFLVLVALDLRETVTGEASDEYQRVIGDRLTDFRLPVLTWPQV
jgi:hypothetical protein